MAQCLAAKIELIAEFRGAKWTGRRSRREIGGGFNHLTCCLKKEMIARHFVNLAETAKKFQLPADISFSDIDQYGNVTNTRRSEKLFASNQSSLRRPWSGAPHVPAGEPRRRPTRPPCGSPSFAALP